MYVEANSPEEFVAKLLTLKEFGLDTANWEVLTPPYDGAQVCKGRPPNVVARLSHRGVVRAERAGDVLPKGVFWFRPVGLFRRREYLVASSCRRRPPLIGWERTTAPVVHDILLAHARASYHMYWPRGLPASPETLRHVAVFGISMSGKTHFTKQFIQSLGWYYVIDITTNAEYADLAKAVEGTVSLSQFTVEELVMLYTIAITAVIGEHEKAAITGVQFGVLRRFASHLRRLESLLEAIQSAQDVPDMTKQVLLSKLYALCGEFSKKGCVPHKALSQEFKPPSPPAVIRVDPSNQAVAAFVVHGILATLLKQAAPVPTYVVIDEVHKVMPKVPVEDPLMQIVVAGRHKNWYAWVSTQTPLHLREDVLHAFPTQVYFALREDAEVAAKLLGVPIDAVVGLRTGEWLAITPSGKRRWAPERKWTPVLIGA